MLSKKKKTSSRIGSWILSRIISQKRDYGFWGDVREVYNSRCKEKGSVRANVWLAKQAIKSIPSFAVNTIYRSGSMFRNYVKIALRNLKNQKVFSLINVSGLAVGIACCILILLFINDELSYDSYHENYDNIYRIITDVEFGGSSRQFADAPSASGPVFVEELPQVLSFTRVLNFFFLETQLALFTYEGNAFEEKDVLAADSTFFNIFTHEFVSGDPEKALNAPGSLVITESAATKIFGNENPLGKVINEAILGDLQITGVIKDVPGNSHFTFEYLVSTSSLKGFSKQMLPTWNFNGYTYLLLQDGTDHNQVQERFAEIVEERNTQRRFTISLQLQKLSDIYLTPARQFEWSRNSNRSYLYLFAAVAVFVLAIACLNFMNLSTAKSIGRAREVGMRKVLGAHKKQLILQFIGESLMLSILALSVAMALVWLVLPQFNSFTGKEITLQFLKDGEILLGILAIIIFSGFIAGSYPAFFLSAFRPIAVLKGNPGERANNPLVRTVFVVVQFSLSLILITSTIVVLNQLDYMKNKHLGFNKDQLLVLAVNTVETLKNPETIKEKLVAHSSITSASVSSSVPGKEPLVRSFIPEGKTRDEAEIMTIIYTDHDFVSTFDVELLSGRDFSNNFPADVNEAFLVNEAAMKRLGWTIGDVGKTLSISSNTGKEQRVIGLIKDFHNTSLKNEIEPIVVTLLPQIYTYLSLKVTTDNIAETLAYVEEVWDEFEPHRDFEYFFLDDDFNKQYQSEEKMAGIFTVFAFIAIFIACLGLFGLASFIAEKRTKEIGIRKVLGATVSGITVQLSKDFTRWILMSNAIGLPIAYFLMNNWLSDFAYRVDLEITTFVLTGISVFVLAILTVSYQSIKSALLDPIKSLRYE